MRQSDEPGDLARALLPDMARMTWERHGEMAIANIRRESMRRCIARVLFPLLVLAFAAGQAAAQDLKDRKIGVVLMHA